MVQHTFLFRSQQTVGHWLVIGGIFIFADVLENGNQFFVPFGFFSVQEHFCIQRFLTVTARQSRRSDIPCTIKSIVNYTIITGRHVVKHLVNLATVIVYLIVETACGISTCGRPTLRRRDIFPLLRVFIKSLRLETRIDNQACGIHRCILSCGREINDATHHLGISLIKLHIIAVYFFHRGKYAVALYLFFDFQHDFFKFSKTLSVDISIITAFTRRG